MTRLLFSLTLVLILSMPGFIQAQGAPANFSFTGYGNQTFLRNIYLGRFELVVGNSEVNTSNVLDRAGELRKVQEAFYEYNKVFSEGFAGSSNRPRRRFHSVVKTEMVTRRGPARVKINQVDFFDTIDLVVQERFHDELSALVDQFVRTNRFEVLQRADKHTRAFYKFLEEEGVNSPVVGQFEENIYRLLTGQTPVQETWSGINRILLFYQGWQSLNLKGNTYDKAACLCTYEALSRNHKQERIWELEDAFTKENFLILSASKADLIPEIWNCLQKK